MLGSTVHARWKAGMKPATAKESHVSATGVVTDVAQADPDKPGEELVTVRSGTATVTFPRNTIVQ